jgi:fluoroquinolone resistance protein
MTIFSLDFYSDQSFNNLEVKKQAFERLHFQDCDFTHCNIAECVFMNCEFDNCTFEGCNLSLTKLPYSFFKQVTFTKCRLMGINWSNADWETKSLLTTKHVDFKDCLLDHSIFMGLNLKETAFRNCQARHLDFEGANLTKSDFQGADLEMSRFVGCDLTEADFVGAQNYQINAAENTLH